MIVVNLLTDRVDVIVSSHRLAFFLGNFLFTSGHVSDGACVIVDFSLELFTFGVLGSEVWIHSLCCSPWNYDKGSRSNTAQYKRNVCLPELWSKLWSIEITGYKSSDVSLRVMVNEWRFSRACYGAFRTLWISFTFKIIIIKFNVLRFFTSWEAIFLKAYWSLFFFFLYIFFVLLLQY